MVAFLRRFLVLILVLLQFAAPLVHAHVGNIGAMPGIHLHEFETLSRLKNDASLEATLSSVGSLQATIVELGQAIGNQAPEQNDTPLYISADLLPVKRHVVEIINFSPHAPGPLFKALSNQHTTRAPPRLN